MLEKIFKLKENNTTAKTEIIAGLTTFMTMAYIIALNPNLLTGFGKDTMPELWNGVFLATCIASAIGTIVMAFLANKPFAMAPGMGLNSFFAVVVTNIVALTGMTYVASFQAALCIVLIEGIVFLVLSVLNIREKIVDAIPLGVRLGIAPAIGLMLLNIGVGSNAGIYSENGGPFYAMRDFFGALASDELRSDSANYYRGGEISAHIEYFETDRYLTYEGDVTLTLCKDGNLDYGQKSFLFTEAEPVIDDTCELYPYFRNGTMMLYGGGTDHAMKSRQCLEEELLRGRAQGFLSEAMSGCMVFVDGEFWGLYLMREAIRPESLAERAGCRVEEIRMVENAYPSQIAPEYGELYRLVTEQNAGSEKIYRQILEQMDVDSFLEYYCANLYFGNPQFDSFSTTVWRQEGEDSIGKWHWEFTDATDTLGRNSLSNYSVNTYLCPQVAGDLFFQGLLKNPDFAESFRRRMQAYADEWTREHVEEALTPILEKYRVAVTVTAQRYGVQQTEEGYLADGDTILTYFDRRGEYILRYTQELLHRNAETE